MNGNGISVDIVEAIDADGGHAAIRITGLRDLPADPTFRIDPIDDAISQDVETDWPRGPRRPAAVKHVNDTFDLVLGPDVLESPLLMPGTPVIVSITGTPVVAELVWPSISSRRPRARRPVILTDELRAAEQSATDAKRQEAAAVLAAATARAAADPVPIRKRNQRKTSRAASLEEASVAVSQNTDDDRVLSSFNLQDPAQQTAAALIRKDGGKVLALPQLTAPSTSLTTLGQSEPGSFRAHIMRQAAAFTGGLALAAVLAFALVQFRVVNIQPVGKTAAGIPDVALTLAKNSGTLRAVLATGGISPRGRTATGVNGIAALRLADGYLYGNATTTRDQGEASFWLRHALSQPIDHESMKWAYTQLGSIFAQPEGFEPDYAKARLLWEIAGALGDPVAMCFNASLYEHGLGVPRHRDLARALYERARSAGGCRGVDDALKRTN